MSETMSEKNKANDKPEMDGLEIAVIGMAGRFPGAKNIDRFWENLKNGIESVTFFSDRELKDAGVSSELLADPNYVKARPIIEDEDIESFDASFFGYMPPEAEIMDPQMRLFHEIAWEALEDAGYDPHRYGGLIGLYAGAARNRYWEAQCMLSGKYRNMGAWTSVQFIDKDFFTLRISYALNLTGPSLSMYTACSTSLVAIHLACQSLLSGECNIALAGGITLTLPNKSGYAYMEGLVMSPDGHCRAFDSGAKGTVGGNGAGIVVLKLFEDALENGDNIYAVIKGSAINNDGMRKGGFTAPSVEGQAEVIQAALQAAHVKPDSIGYIEAHGTATPLGDPIELEALKLVFNTDKEGTCAVGSIKSNMGHLDSAAGVAGFIKTALALKHRLIPPSLHFSTPNPELYLENSPFYVNTGLKEWRPGTLPLRAGVSAFGVGGTNAHVVLEEWVDGYGTRYRAHREVEEREYKLLLLSAGTPTALDRMTENLADFIRNRPAHNDFPLADAAYTLQVGRRAFKYRRMLVCSDAKEAVDLLAPGSSPDSGNDGGKVKTLALEENNRPVVFMFPGLGSQYVDMGRELYEKGTVFREKMDRCFEILKPLMGYDIKEYLYPPGGNRSHLNQPEIAQVALFVFEYALAALLMEWGITPRAMIGYSFGEYVAACTAGVFSLEEALKLVVTRGQLIRELPEGGMLSVPLPLKELEPLLHGHDELSVAIDNGPSCVVAGPAAAVDAFETQIKEKKYMPMRVENSRAIHSPMMAPISGKLKDHLHRTALKAPEIPYISNVTGTWITDGETADPEYWVAHLKQTVRFADGMKRLLKEFPNCILVEIGPGRDIGTLALRHIESVAGDDSDKKNRYTVMNLVRHPRRQVSDVYFLLNRIGRLWLCGRDIDWFAFHRREKRRRISLPPYPFDRRRYRIDPDVVNKRKHVSAQETLLQRKNNIDDWFYIPSWKRIDIPPHRPGESAKISGTWLLAFVDAQGLGGRLVKELETMDARVITVENGPSFSEINEGHFTVNPRQEADYESLFRDLHRQGKAPGHILHFWGVTGENNGETPGESVVSQLDMGFYSLINIARAVGNQGITDEIHLTAITDNMQEVVGKDGRYPGKSTVLAPVEIIPTEYPNMKCRSIDVVLPPPGNSGRDEEETILRQLRDELTAEPGEPVIAYRGGYRWVRSYEPGPVAGNGKKGAALVQSGVYLVTGGLGGIGLALAEYLAESVCARLILTGRTGLPDRGRWESLLTDPGCDSEVKAKIQKIIKLEERGAEVLVLNADVSRRDQMETAIAQAEERFGSINGVIHCAGLPGGELITRGTRESLEKVLEPKIKGTQVLDGLLKDRALDFFILCSALGSILPMPGQAAYYAANSYLDAFAHYKRTFDRQPTVSINWDRWRRVGFAVIAEDQHKNLTGKEMEDGISINEGTEAFSRILSAPLTPLPQVVVLTRDLQTLLARARTLDAASFLAGVETAAESGTVLPRPELDNEYVAPTTGIEEKLARRWATFFGIQKVGITDDFIELGGDSLKALMLLPKINKEFEVNIGIAEFFAEPIIQQLAAFIDGADRQTDITVEPVEKREYYSLSPAQKRLFVQRQVAPKSTAYNELTTISIGGNFPVSVLEDLFKILIQRHESLRTSFEMVGEEPVQRIHDNAAFEIESFDSATGDHSSTILNFVRPFDLSRAPLMRAGLLKIDAHRQILLIDMHHLIVDGRSFEILLDELVLLYKGNELPEPNLQYKDFSEWQRRFFENQQDVMTRQKDYWLSTFKDRVPPLKLPNDYPRPMIRSFEGNRVSFELDPGRTNILKEIASREELTLFMLLLGIFSVFLSKLSGQEDVVIGSPILGRNHPDVQSIIGMFVNTLALRSFPTGSKQFSRFLKEMKETLIEALDNQDYPFDELVEQLGIRRDAGRNPLFDVTFAMLNTRLNERGPQEQKQDTKGPAFQEYTVEERMSKFDLGLEAMEGDNTIFLTFVYCTKLFKKETVERFIIYFNEIINIVSENTNIQLKDILISHGLLEFDSTMPEVDFKL